MSSCATFVTFLIVTLLLPLFLTAPVERDRGLISLVNPFHTAAVRVLRISVFLSLILLTEGQPERALRTSIFIRHLHCALDALPSGSQVPRTDVHSQFVPVVSDKVQRSNTLGGVHVNSV